MFKASLYICAFFTAMSVHAAETSTISETQDQIIPQESITDGIRVALIAPMTSEADAEAFGQKVDLDTDQNLGLSIGYETKLDTQLGVIANLAYVTYDNTNGMEDADSLRLDGNLAGYLTNSFYMHGGFNYQKFLGTDFKDITPGIGYQLGAGYKLNRHLALNFSYIETTQEMEMQTGFGDVDVDLRFESIEMAIIYTL